MAIDKISITQTQEWIVKALLSLMGAKDYREITVVDIVSQAHIGRRTFYRYFKHKDDILLLYCNRLLEDFAEIIREKGKITLYSVTLSYFEFWSRHLDFLKLLEKSNMLYFFGDRLPEFLARAAVLTGHVRPEQIALEQMRKGLYYYAHYFNMGGYWSITTVWLKDEQRETPEAMAQMMVEIILRRE